MDNPMPQIFNQKSMGQKECLQFRQSIQGLLLSRLVLVEYEMVE